MNPHMKASVSGGKAKRAHAIITAARVGTALRAFCPPYNSPIPLAYAAVWRDARLVVRKARTEVGGLPVRVSTVGTTMP